MAPYFRPDRDAARTETWTKVPVRFARPAGSYARSASPRARSAFSRAVRTSSNESASSS